MVSRNFLSLEQIHAYSISSSLSDNVWAIVSLWDHFNKQTLGAQYQRAIDSIAGNVAEGFGRFYKKDKQRFYYNARGSLFEARHWTEKANKRKLLSEEQYNMLIKQLELLPREINWLIKITEEKLQK